jgi:hypothetical protein
MGMADAAGHGFAAALGIGEVSVIVGLVSAAGVFVTAAGFAASMGSVAARVSPPALTAVNARTIKTTINTTTSTRMAARMATRSQRTRSCPPGRGGECEGRPGRPDDGAHDGRGGDVTAMPHPDAQ